MYNVILFYVYSCLLHRSMTLWSSFYYNSKDFRAHYKLFMHMLKYIIQRKHFFSLINSRVSYDIDYIIMLFFTGRAVFAPSCVSHTVLTKKDWMNIKINSVSLPAALHCWLIETRYAKLHSNKLGSGRVNNSNNHKHHHDDDDHKNAEGALTKVDGHTTENALKTIKQKTPRPRGNIKFHSAVK